MLLNEIINTRQNDIEYVETTTDYYYEVRSKINNLPYCFSASSSHYINDRIPENVLGNDRKNINAWEIIFGIDPVDDEDESDELIVDLTGTGDSIKVFTWVESCFNLFIQKYNNRVRFVLFSSDVNEPSRVKLYDAIVKFLVRRGWKFHGKTNEGHYVHYICEKNS